jgi:5-formyltetrahydrofolate cyclo-ligase
MFSESEPKQSLRKQLLQERLRLSPEEVRDRSLRITDNLLSVLPARTDSRILIYYPIRNEVETQGLRDFFWAAQIPVLLPHCADEHQLRPVLYSADTELRPGKYGIPEPCPTPDPSSTETPDIVIVPCLASDHKKYRLGYGAGYYDRYLNAIPALKIGLCYDFQILPEIPANAHDIRLDWVISETQMIK